ncbi:MAG: NAD(P)-dependent oxidoreductase, partial [Blastocatellia bacterium]
SYLAAPVFGRPEAAAAAKLWVIVSGKEDVIASCRPVFDAISQGVFVAGVEPGAANVIKISGNFLIASMLEALGETFALIRKSGVEPAKFLEVVTALFRSPIYQNYGLIVAEQKYEPAGFKLKLGLKDVKLAIEAAEGVDMAMPLGSLVRDHYLSAIARGEGDIDWAGLGRVIARAAGLPD